jgi:AraC-like DNA-binding protein
MENSRFVFTEIDSHSSFNRLANALGSEAIDNSIYIPPTSGYGIVRKLDIEKGLHIRAWDINLYHPFGIDRTPPEDNAKRNAFSIICIFSPSSVNVKCPSMKIVNSEEGSMNVLVLAKSMGVSFELQAGLPVKVLDITVSEDWMNSECDPAFISFLKSRSKPTLFMVPVNSEEYRLATELQINALSGLKDLVSLKTETQTLVSNFFTKVFPRQLVEENVLHQDKILMVQQILELHFEKTLPTIERIAKEAALSESTLKRHFKLMFGKSIYEYYLQKKMDYAKRLLMENSLTVKEVAFRLGYEKTSNFIHMFKKFHTHSPGHMRKNFSILEDQ